jgi:hypothetical protein
MGLSQTDWDGIQKIVALLVAAFGGWFGRARRKEITLDNMAKRAHLRIDAIVLQNNLKEEKEK